MIRKLNVTIKALKLFLTEVETFDPQEIFGGKRVAVIGAANTAFEQENGSYINSFDLVVRVNKAILSWRPEQEKFIGKKTDVLFHSFYENESSGGGPIDFENFEKFGLQYLVHPTNSPKGYRVHLNFYKRHLRNLKTYLLSKPMYRMIDQDFTEKVPTTGYFALIAALRSPCKELYITGFTFFKTPYSPGYRDHLVDQKVNKQHIQQQGLHDPDLELRLFKQHLKNSNCENVQLDPALYSIVESAE